MMNDLQKGLVRIQKKKNNLSKKFNLECQKAIITNEVLLPLEKFEKEDLKDCSVCSNHRIG